MRCRRATCDEEFTPRCGGGITQAFCSPECRRAFHTEARHAGYQVIQQRPPRAAKRRARPTWAFAVDAATGRRVRLQIKTPAELLAC
jgi:hypothetical protein